LSQISPTPPAPAWTGLLHCFAGDDKTQLKCIFKSICSKELGIFAKAIGGRELKLTQNEQ